MGAFGVNTNPVYPGGEPNPNELRHDVGVSWVRMVSKEWVAPDVAQYHDAGLKVLAVITSESYVNGTFYLVPGADAYQIGNEPDLEGESSWTMTPSQYVDLWYSVRPLVPEGKMAIMAGLASGQPGWLRPIAQHFQNCHGLAFHPYLKNGSTVNDLIDDYRNIRPDLPLWATEFNNPAHELKAMIATLGRRTRASFWFAWSDAMVPNHGLVNQTGQQKPEYGLFRDGIQPFKWYEEVGPGFRQRLDQLGLREQGPERYFVDGYSFVLSDRGPIWYSAFTNTVVGPDF